MKRFKERLRGFEGWIWEKEGFLRDLFRIAEIFVYEFRRNSLSLRASALTYTIVLSMVPLLALGTAVLKGLGAGDQIRTFLLNFLDQFGSGAANPAVENIKTVLEKLFEYVDRTNFTTLGIFGVLGLIWAVISTLSKIEDAMNAIWKAEKARPVGRKIMDYTALVVLLPLSINLVIGVTALSEVRSIAKFVDKFLPFPVMSSVFFKLLPVFVLIGVFSILYRFLPNVYVKPKAALIGGVVGGLLWSLVQIAYIKLQIGVTRYNAIYGSFATIPLFLIWLHMGWLMFLAGAQVSFAVQFKDFYNPAITPSAAVRLAVAVAVMIRVYEKFRAGEAFFPEKEVRHLGYSEIFIADAIGALKEEGLLAETSERGILPAVDPNALDPGRIIDAVWGKLDPKTKSENLVAEAILSAKKRLSKIFREQYYKNLNAEG